MRALLSVLLLAAISSCSTHSSRKSGPKQLSKKEKSTLVSKCSEQKVGQGMPVKQANASCLCFWDDFEKRGGHKGAYKATLEAMKKDEVSKKCDEKFKNLN